MLKIILASLPTNPAQDMKKTCTHVRSFRRMRKVVGRDWILGVSVRKHSQNRRKCSFLGKIIWKKEPLGLSCAHLPGMVALGPRSANHALRYLHHAGIGLVLPKFGWMPRVRSAGKFTAPGQTQGGTPKVRHIGGWVSSLIAFMDLEAVSSDTVSSEIENNQGNTRK